MGGDNSKTQKHKLKIASLNYSGILKSPYEFYEPRSKGELNELTAKFLIGLEFVGVTIEEKFFDWDFSILEKEWQQDRYSPMYLPSCGMNNSFMMCEQDFIQKWNFMRTKFTLQSEKIQEHHFENLCRFDLCIYQAILRFLYTEPSEAKMIKENFKIKDQFNLDSKKYRNFQKKMFEKPFLNKEIKILKIIKAINLFQIDIFFLQEADIYLVSQIEKRLPHFRVVKALKENNPDELETTSIIIIRDIPFFRIRSLLEENEIFKNNIQDLTLQDSSGKVFLPKGYMTSLNFNKDTVVQAIGNLILISSHLTSKQSKNYEQLHDLKKKLKDLKSKFPHCHIVLGGDLNGNFKKVYDESRNVEKEVGRRLQENDKANQNQSDQKIATAGLSIYPENHITCNKVRTISQAQLRKANQICKQIKDYLISTLEIHNFQIMTISGTRIEEQYDPAVKNKNPKMPQSSEESLRKLGMLRQQSKHAKLQSCSKLINENLIPNEKHPYDHYLLIGEIHVPSPLMKMDTLEYKQKFKPEDLTEEEIDRIFNRKQEERDGL